MKLPTLYKKTSTGADQEWTISVQGSKMPNGPAVIETVFGQVGGKLQTASDVVSKGKNIGRSNETTPEEQANAEAQSQWEKKLKRGYVKNLADAREGVVDGVIEGGVFPMLAHKFDEQGHKITYPAFVQPKFDGHRCIAMIDEDGKATLWTRTRKPITGLPHIIENLERFSKNAKIRQIILDGELYNHNYRDNFEALTSFIRNPEPKEGHEVVEYHIYDIAGVGAYTTRYIVLRSLFMVDPNIKALVRVETVEVDDEEDLMLAFDKFLAQGYEGAMVRNADGLYVNKRSYDLQKVKEFLDAEFKVVGVEEGRGKLAGHAIFVCETGEGVQFRAKMKGALEDLKQYFERPELAIGKELSVKYQGLTGKNKVPRFPVAWRFTEKL